MNSIFIESIEYIGENYYYKNDKLKKGVNIVLGENKHGKTTFTYLIMYVLGFNIESFKKNCDDKIAEITNDKENYISIKINISNEIYILKRKIGDNVISIIQEGDVKILPIKRYNTLFKKDDEIFSDWLMKKLNINLIKVENIFSSEHYLNFDDLFRFSYYDQETNKKQMISNFGLNNNIVKNSSQMKKFIFETILSNQNSKFYKKQKEVKELENKIKDKKAELRFKKDIYEYVSANIISEVDNFSKQKIKNKISILQTQKNNLINLPNSISEKKNYLDALKDDVAEINKKIFTYKEKEDELNLELKNARRLNKIERKEIKSLEILSELPNIYEDNENQCPICGKDIIIEKDKCICGNNIELDLFHFIYTKEDYIDILKSKVSVNKTTKQVIKDLEIEIEDIKRKIEESNKKIDKLLNSIDKINEDIITPDVEVSIKEINSEIAILDDLYLRLTMIEDENASLENINKDILKLEESLNTKKSELRDLEIKKYEMLEESLKLFETTLNKYLDRYYKALGENHEYKIKLNRDYLPIRGNHIPHSELTEIKIFYYLTILKLSINNNNITYPKLLIIDTIKDHGIDIKRLEKILEIICEFDDSDCQILMTSGYEEFNNLEDRYSDLVIERIGKLKLLKKR